MSKVYVKWNPLHEKLVCAHSTEEDTCELCETASELLENTPYFLHGEWLSIDSGIKLCYCGNPVDLSNPDCVEFNLCKEHQLDT